MSKIIFSSKRQYTEMREPCPRRRGRRRNFKVTG